jgi:hypothetical protein
MNIDISKTIEAKSDHLASDDLIGGSKTIKITKVSVVNGDRPVVIEYVGGEGKSYLPCKSMRRVMASAWGVNGSDWVGQSLTLYRDNAVKFGGKEVGGIRISHMTGLDKSLKLSVSASRGSKVTLQIEPMNGKAQQATTRFKPLDIVNQTQEQAPERPLADIEGDISNCKTCDELTALYKANAGHSLVTDIIKACTTRKAKILEQEQQEVDYMDYDASTGEIVDAAEPQETPTTQEKGLF